MKGIFFFFQKQSEWSILDIFNCNIDDSIYAVLAGWIVYCDYAVNCVYPSYSTVSSRCVQLAVCWSGRLIFGKVNEDCVILVVFSLSFFPLLSQPPSTVHAKSSSAVNVPGLIAQCRVVYLFELYNLQPWIFHLEKLVVVRRLLVVMRVEKWMKVRGSEGI